jgi:PucR C-terminal helix-turn-helix domain
VRQDLDNPEESRTNSCGIIKTVGRHPFDLQAFDDLRNDPDGWSDLMKRETGEPFVDVVVAVAAATESITDGAISRIVSTVEEYARVGPRQRGELWWSTRRNLQAILVCLAEERPFTVSELAVRRTVGTRAVERGMPLAALMRAFHLGYVELWERAAATANELGPRYSTALFAHAILLWSSLEQLSSATTEAYWQAVRLQDSQARHRGLALIADLHDLPRSATDAERHLHELGIDPEGSFLWSAFRGHADQFRASAALVVDTADGSVALLSGADLQANSEHELASLLLTAGARNVGLGTVRSGLIGAQRSLIDAERAHRAAVALDLPTVLFREDWLACLTLNAASDLSDILEPVFAKLDDVEVESTLAAYLAADGKLSAAGEALALHPNTVAYRLQRIADQVGLDARTSRGMAQASAVLVLQQARRRARVSRPPG